MKLKLNPRVAVPSVVIIIVFVLLGSFFPNRAEALFGSLKGLIEDGLGWIYILSVAFFLIFVIALAVSPFGKIRLGPDDSRPDYSYLSWFAMLFSAGMGIGLLYFSVAEPLFHFDSPPIGKGGMDPSLGMDGRILAAKNAMRLTFFHWGLHAWGIYIVVGMSLAYFSFRKKLPLSIRSSFYPLLKERIYGWPGHLIDILAIFGTVFGVATSLGLGVLQINAGLNYLFGFAISPYLQVGLIVIITAMATLSVGLGLNRGIRRLSEFNMILALILVVFAFVCGPTLFLLRATVENTGFYLQHIANTTFWMDAYRESGWQGWWTLFYWGWWIAWSPFVGIFIARISRGRTIREFIVGVLFVPTAVTIIWMTVLGNGALYEQLFGDGGLVAIVNADSSLALYAYLETLPWPIITSVLATVLIVTFFVTSADSGALVIDMLASGGKANPPVYQRVFWAVLQGSVAAVLLLSGGLLALQTASIVTGLPFAIVLLVMCFSLLKSLRGEDLVSLAPGGQILSTENGEDESSEVDSPDVVEADWRTKLMNIAHLEEIVMDEDLTPEQKKRRKVDDYLSLVAMPAFRSIRKVLSAQGREVLIQRGEQRLEMVVKKRDKEEFYYCIRVQLYRKLKFAFPILPLESEEGETARAEVYLRSGRLHLDVTDYNSEQIIENFLYEYQRWIQWEK